MVILNLLDLQSLWKETRICMKMKLKNTMSKFRKFSMKMNIRTMNISEYEYFNQIRLSDVEVKVIISSTQFMFQIYQRQGWSLVCITLSLIKLQDRRLYLNKFFC